MRGRRVVAALVCAAELTGGPASARGQQQPAASEATGAAQVAADAPPEGPPDQAAALAHFRAGRRHYDERRYREAAAEFQKSLDAHWSIEAAYNMALSLDRAGDVVAAYAAYRDYLARAEPGDKHRATAEAHSEQLRQRLAEVLLQLDSPEAIREIRLNGVAVDREAFPLITAPGPLAVEFIGEAAGQVQQVRADVRPGGTATIVFPGFPRAEPQPVVRPPPKPDEPPVDPRRQRALRAGFWTSAGLTAASGVAIGVFGAQALEAKRDRDNLMESCGVPCDPAFALGLEDKLRTSRAATNVMIGATVAFGIAALALGVVALRERPRRTAETRARLRWLGPAASLTF